MRVGNSKGQAVKTQVSKFDKSLERGLINVKGNSFPVIASLSCIWLFVTPWTVANQAPLSMGILQARILEWVALPSSGGSSQPKDRTQVSRIVGRFFAVWAIREAHVYIWVWFTSPLLNSSMLVHVTIVCSFSLNIIWFIYLLYYWWLWGCFSFRAIMNSAAVNILIHVFDEPRCSFLLGIYLGINCRRSHVVLAIFSFW